MPISALRPNRHVRRITAAFTLVAATQLVFAPALRLCGASHHAAIQAHAMTHQMAHHGGHGTPNHPAQAPGQHDGGSSGDECLLMRGCEAIAIAPPLLITAEADAQLPWPLTDVARLQSVDRAPDAPPPRA